MHEDTPGPADTVAVKASEDHTFIGNQNSFSTAYRQCEIIQDQKSITDVSSKSPSSEQTGCSDEGLLLETSAILFYSYWQYHHLFIVILSQILHRAQ